MGTMACSCKKFSLSPVSELKSRNEMAPAQNEKGTAFHILYILARSLLMVSLASGVGCGEWAPMGPGPSVRIETSSSGADVRRTITTEDCMVKSCSLSQAGGYGLVRIAEKIGTAPVLDELSTRYEPRRYRRNPACFPAAFVAGALIGLATYAAVKGPSGTDSVKYWIAAGTGVGAELIGLLGCALRTADGKEGLYKINDKESRYPLTVSYTAELPGRARSASAKISLESGQIIRLPLTSQTGSDIPQESILLSAGSSPGSASHSPSFGKTSGAGQARRRLAVLEFSGRNLEADVLGAFSDAVRGGAVEALSGGENLKVMTRENMLVMLRDMGQKECVEGDCEVETARNIGADFVISGSVAHMDNTFVVTLKIHETQEGAVLATDTLQARRQIDMLLQLRDRTRDLVAKHVTAIHSAGQK
jgi:TolB-like protein